MSVLRGTIYLSISRIASLLLNMWAIGMYVHWLGDESWGGIALMIVLMAFCATICDLGLNMATLNSLVKAHTENDQVRANRVLATNTAICMTAFGVVAVAYILAYQLHYVRSVGHDVNGMLYFGLASFTTMFSLINFSQSSALASRGGYSYLAVTSTAAAFTNTALSLGLIYITRQPWSYWAGSCAGVLCNVILNEIKLRKLGFGSPRVGLYWKEFEDVIAFLRKSWVANTAFLVNGMDRVAMGRVISEANLGVFDQAARVPVTLTSTMPIAQVFPAEVARVSHEGEASLAEAYRKLSSATMALMMAVLFIPSACSESYLHLIYPVFQPVMLPIYILACADGALSLYGSLFAVFANATARPHLAAPFIWFMLLGTAILAFPVASAYGIVGVAAARVALQLIQFVPLEWAAKKVLIPQLDLREIITKKAFIVATAAIFWVIGFRLIYALGLQANALAGVAISFLMSYTYMACLYGSGAVWLPRRLAGLLPKFVQNLARGPS